MEYSAGIRGGGHPGTGVCKSVKVLKCKSAKMQKCKSEKMHKCNSAKVQECNSAKVHRTILECLTTKSERFGLQQQ